MELLNIYFINLKNDSFFSLSKQKSMVQTEGQSSLWYPFTLFHHQIVPSQIVVLNSQVVAQYSQNFSQVFRP